MRSNKINDGMETEVVFKNKRNPKYTFKVFKTRDGRISRIENNFNIRFPFHVGQLFNRIIEVWACNNGYLINDKDTCTEEKVMGIKVSDIPQGHQLRHLYPHKFKK